MSDRDDIRSGSILAMMLTEKGNCDKGGCGYNPYSSGQHNFWAPGGTVDTSKTVTVVTQFQGSGQLQSVTRKYIQNGREIGEL